MVFLHSDSSQDVNETSQRVDHLLDEIALLDDRGQIVEETSILPNIRVYESEAEISLYIEIKGVDFKDLDVKVSEEAVFVKGKRKLEFRSKHRGMTFTESYWGPFQRVISLPTLVENCKIQAGCIDGFLCLTMPKAEHADHRVVSLTLPRQPESFKSTLAPL
jgi:HSP20 family protein